MRKEAFRRLQNAVWCGAILHREQLGSLKHCRDTFSMSVILPARLQEHASRLKWGSGAGSIKCNNTDLEQQLCMVVLLGTGELSDCPADALM